MIGKFFGELEVIAKSPNGTKKHDKWLCRSVRTQQTGEVWGSALRSGKTKSGREFDWIPFEDCRNIDHFLSQMSWTSDGKGYFQCNKKGKLIKRHRLIWTVNHGDIPNKYLVDHINRRKGDDRIENLRLLTQSQQNLNFDKRITNKSTSKHKGVIFDKGGWYFVINLGGFRTKKKMNSEKEAALAYNEYMLNEAPRELVLEHDLPGNVAGRFIPILNVV